MTTIRNAESRQIPHLFSPALARGGFDHGFFSRHGGVSPSPWHSLNTAFGLGDQRDNVLENRQRIKNTLGLKCLVSARQVHGSKVLPIHATPAMDREVEGCDALVTGISGIGLMVQQADCQAVLLADPIRRAIGIAHVGWRGSVANIIAKTVAAMVREYSTEPADLQAAISPSLGPCCAEFTNYRTELPIEFHANQPRPDYFDFWVISRNQLQAAGVRPSNIVSSGVCTRCNEDYFSYRRDTLTGRGASVIGMFI